MSARLFICADCKYPRGDAGANRVHYIAKALKEYGMDVYIISSISPRSTEQHSDEWMEFDHIHYRTVFQITNGALHTIMRKTIYGYMVGKILAAANPVAGRDLVLLYGSNSIVLSPIAKYCMRRRIKCFIDVVEHHQPYQYRFGCFDIRYLANSYTFHYLAPHIGNIIVISTEIQTYYKQKGYNAAVIPAITDTNHSLPKRTEKPFINLIYPGNPFGKENVITMLNAIRTLPVEIRDSIRFHMTGIDESTLRNKLRNHQALVDDLCPQLVFHDWLPYDELIVLYEKMDFLFMPRLDNCVTRSNFPSKLPELMSWGIVPIGNMVGDYYHYLHDGIDSILFQNDDTHDCAEALIRVAKMGFDELLQMQQKATETVEREFDYRGWVNKLGRIFEDEHE